MKLGVLSLSCQRRYLSNTRDIVLVFKCPLHLLSIVFIIIQLHPDKNKELQNTHQEFVKLNEAYSVLIKPEARRQYDLTLRQNQILPPICHERPSPVRE